MIGAFMLSFRVKGAFLCQHIPVASQEKAARRKLHSSVGLLVPNFGVERILRFQKQILFSSSWGREGPFNKTRDFQ